MENLLRRALKIAQRREQGGRGFRGPKGTSTAGAAPAKPMASVAAAADAAATTATLEAARSRPASAKGVDEQQVVKSEAAAVTAGATAAAATVQCVLQGEPRAVHVAAGAHASAAELRAALEKAFAAAGRSVAANLVLVAVDASGEAMAVSDAAPWPHVQRTAAAFKFLQPGS